MTKGETVLFERLLKEGGRVLHISEKFIKAFIGEPEDDRIDLWYMKLWSFINGMSCI